MGFLRLDEEVSEEISNNRINDTLKDDRIVDDHVAGNIDYGLGVGIDGVGSRSWSGRKRLNRIDRGGVDGIDGVVWIVGIDGVNRVVWIIGINGVNRVVWIVGINGVDSLKLLHQLIFVICIVFRGTPLLGEPREAALEHEVVQGVVVEVNLLRGSEVLQLSDLSDVLQLSELGEVHFII